MTDTNTTLDKLAQKYESQGQNLDTHLEGLYHAKPITYWDYIQVDTLLSLQKPRTDFPDEMVFIMYHQVTELIFKMIQSEVDQITQHPKLNASFFAERLKRISRYFDMLCSSFDVMQFGMEPAQYLKFRDTLTPASGFQCASYRIIEICSADLIRLVDKRYRDDLDSNAGEKEMFDKIYWQAAGYDHSTGKRTMTLQLFIDKYMDKFIATAKEFKNKNFWQLYKNLPEAEKTDQLKAALRDYDLAVNVRWPMVHLRAAEEYLESEKETKEATGGSDWKKYMHPMYQRRIFYPELWSQEELDNWGKNV